MSDNSSTAETASLTPPAADAEFETNPGAQVETTAFPVHPAPTTDAGACRPRTRWAAIIWGAVFAAIAAAALWVTVSPDRRTALADWTVSLSPAAIAAYGVLAIGAIALVAGLVGILRRAQRALDARRGHHGAAT